MKLTRVGRKRHASNETDTRRTKLTRVGRKQDSSDGNEIRRRLTASARADGFQPQRRQKDTKEHGAARARIFDAGFGGVALRRARPTSGDNASRLKQARFALSSDSAALAGLRCRPAGKAGWPSCASCLRG